MLKNTSVKGVSLKIWQYEWRAVATNNNGMGEAPEIAKVYTCITSLIPTKMEQMSSELASMWNVDEGRVVAW